MNYTHVDSSRILIIQIASKIFSHHTCYVRYDTHLVVFVVRVWEAGNSRCDVSVFCLHSVWQHYVPQRVSERFRRAVVEAEQEWPNKQGQ